MSSSIDEQRYESASTTMRNSFVGVETRKMSLKGYITSSFLGFMLVLFQVSSNVFESSITTANETSIIAEANPEECPLTLGILRHPEHIFGYSVLNMATLLVSHPALVFTAILVELLSDSVNLVATVNMAVCALIVAFLQVVRFVFHEIQYTEFKRIRDNLVNYLLFKTVFVGVILEPAASDMAIWTLWFALIGFLRTFTTLARDRFNSYFTEDSASDMDQWNTVVLLCGVLLLNTAWCLSCIFLFQEAGTSVLLLLVFECVTLFLETLQVMGKYVVRLMGKATNTVVDASPVYYVEFGTDCANLIMTWLHYARIWYCHGITFTLVDMILLLNLHAVSRSLKQKLLTHLSLKKTLAAVANCVREATEEEISLLRRQEESCPICLQLFEDKVSRLSCGHFFHSHCFHKWLESVSHASCTCPLCRFDFTTVAEATAVAAKQQDNCEAFPSTGCESGMMVHSCALRTDDEPVGGNNAQVTSGRDRLLEKRKLVEVHGCPQNVHLENLSGNDLQVATAVAPSGLNSENQ